jgi:predicted GNAT family acetyltransferase
LRTCALGDADADADADAPEILPFARLTEPGPFLERKHTMGRFIGIRIDGRLAAMAGERMHVRGYTEVGGVCMHPDCRGRGLARRLSAAVAVAIEARGERPFLHALAQQPRGDRVVREPWGSSCARR